MRAAQRALGRPWARRVTLAISGMLLALFAIEQTFPQALGHHRPVSDHASLTLLQHWRVAEQTAAGMAAFERAIAGDRFRDAPPERLLGRLHGADVLLVFVESYGRSALEQPRYAETLLPTLAAFEQRLAPRLHDAFNVIVG